MRVLIEVGFESPEIANAALKAFGKGGGKAGNGREGRDGEKPAEGGAKACVKVGVEKKTLRVEVEAREFPALRARATSALRDIKVIVDAIGLKKGKGGLIA